MVQEDPSMEVESGLQDGKRIPVVSMVESIVGCKWSVRILQLCAEGHNRPGRVLRACPGLSAKVMNERWRKMIRFGIMRRTVFGTKPPVEVEYQLTSFGRRFLKILDEVRRLQEAVDDGAIPETSKPRKKTKSSGRVTNLKKAKRPSAPASSSKS